MKSAALIVCALLTGGAAAAWLDSRLHPPQVAGAAALPAERPANVTPAPVPGHGAAPGGFRPEFRLPAGVPAPDLALRSLDGEPVRRLRDFRGHPTVLAFGSFSCDLFGEEAAALERLHRAYRGRAAVLLITVPEAGHPTSRLQDDWAWYMKGRLSPERRATWICRAACQLGLTVPIYTVTEAELGAYHPWPARLVLLGPDGRVVRDAGLVMGRQWQIEQMGAELDRLLSIRPAGGGTSGAAAAP